MLVIRSLLRAIAARHAAVESGDQSNFSWSSRKAPMPTLELRDALRTQPLTLLSRPR
jgi:hypothetical protein